MRESIRSENLDNRPGLLALYKFFEANHVLGAPRVSGCVDQFTQGKSGRDNDEFSMHLWRLYKALLVAADEAYQVGDEKIAEQRSKEINLISFLWRGRGKGWLSSDHPPEPGSKAET